MAALVVVNPNRFRLPNAATKKAVRLVDYIFTLSHLLTKGNIAIMKTTKNILKIAFYFKYSLKFKVKIKEKFMQKNLEPQGEIVPNQSIPSLPKRNWAKLGIFSTVVIVLASLIFYAGTWYAGKNKTKLEMNKVVPAENSTSISENWQDRLIYEASDFNYPKQTQQIDLKSITVDGDGEKESVLVCDNESALSLEQFGNIARSPDGKTLAFLLPAREQKTQNPNWKKDLIEGKKPFTQGVIYLFNLKNNQCESTGLTADYLYNQSLKFSPNGKLLAYVFFGLHVYNLETKMDKQLTIQEGSAHFPNLVLGPLVWNQKSITVYMPVTGPFLADFLTKGIFPTNLVRVDITKAVDIKSIKLSDDPNIGEGPRDIPRFEANDRNQTIVMKLADYYTAEAEKQFFPLGVPLPTKVPDNPSIIAISPDETKIIIEENGNLVIKNLVNVSTQSTLVYSKKDYAPYEPYGHARKVVWLPSGWILMSLGQTAGGSGAGFMLASLNGEKPVQIPGHLFSANASGDKFVYNFSYFGIYYVPPEGPVPSGFRRGIDDTGHRYDGIGIYDLNNKKDTKISGKNKPAGIIWPWFF
ncbi:hypothetical protein COU96_03140 [Candidatus Shapirobacteria bacterium CG10_big_fil_rev_8_21_14_0_10_38_14]|uniref:Uncharacterized protein n=1 Tax=Candidatus Shapirobacteria bacterium CG10_big_fil_rev_8_21_14_0_10_38_14 TaxID=1974483 RepID=A0A2M8L4Q4_9BACT|nr:MAG: hypothetical protein COU96_03140 [Candidatus Shapirobacteria bacterium CG10_big_fil_rev_8_21_14_0_10_38_14]